MIIKRYKKLYNINITPFANQLIGIFNITILKLSKYIDKIKHGNPARIEWFYNGKLKGIDYICYNKYHRCNKPSHLNYHISDMYVTNHISRKRYLIIVRYYLYHRYYGNGPFYKRVIINR